MYFFFLCFFLDFWSCQDVQYVREEEKRRFDLPISKFIAPGEAMRGRREKKLELPSSLLDYMKAEKLRQTSRCFFEKTKLALNSVLAASSQVTHQDRHNTCTSRPHLDFPFLFFISFEGKKSQGWNRSRKNRGRSQGYCDPPVRVSKHVSSSSSSSSSFLCVLISNETKIAQLAISHYFLRSSSSSLLEKCFY